MRYIDEVSITDKTILLRVDFNVSFSTNHTITDDVRIKQSLPTIRYLLRHHNKLILIAHLGEPEKRNESNSLNRVAKRLQEYFPNNKVILVDDFLSDSTMLATQTLHDIVLLENIRFYPGEQKNDLTFVKQLASLGDVYVNDAFSVCHRKAASIVGLPKMLPAYGGLLLKKEVTILEKLMKHAKKPFVAVIGGKKISTKIAFITKLTSIADYLLLGGGLANTFLASQGHKLGDSLVEKNALSQAKEIIAVAKKRQTQILLPSDVVVAVNRDGTRSEIKTIDAITTDEEILDIGPKTQAMYAAVIEKAQTIIWNGPVGYIENPLFKRGTDFLYYAITQNETAVSVIGGGDTLAAIAKKEYLDRITHISTGGGAMLEFIENGTLAGIEALNKSHT